MVSILFGKLFVSPAHMDNNYVPLRGSCWNKKRNIEAIRPNQFYQPIYISVCIHWKFY